ncbi:Holliday junction resolvase RuvX [Pseudahrensia aquimaris]|uniref:Putative pre-16S rRNA nuclease n=1 Tax=Pseudahrensia aquimaris TaxID=744461 RepID=A0ABW3FK49_9HYPH
MNQSDLHDVEAFAARLQGAGRLLALDLGSKTIGLAISDSMWTVASPLHTIKRTKFSKDAAALQEIVAREYIHGLVIGWPINMNGTEGPRCQATSAFQRNLSRLMALPMMYWDERLSSVAAERAMLEADLSRAKRAERIDSVAASVILQAALDRLYEFRR